MSPLSAKAIFCAILLAAAASGEGTVEGQGKGRRFISEKYRFSMAIPVGWGVSARLDTPVYFYAPNSGRFIQDSLPEGGAVITVAAHDTVSGLSKSAATPKDWALLDMRGVASGNPSTESFEMPKLSRVSQAATSSYDEVTLSPDQRTQHSIAIFWEFEGRLFAAHLNYNATDPNGPELKRVFFEAVRSLRPLEKTER
jgi:hypothetical protein